jgi:type IV secretory pathway VirB4 component
VNPRTRGASRVSSSGRRTGLWPLRVPAHRASSAVLAGAYPFLAPAPPQTGVYIGPDALTGEAFAFDPWALYAAGELTNPNILLAGVIGQGKSALAKSLALRSLAAGRRVYVPGDPKGEWAPLADAVGGTVIRIGRGLAARLNPLDAPPSSRGSTSSTATVLAAVAATLLARDLTPAEHTALHAALAAAHADTNPTLPRLVDALADPDPGAAAADRTTVAARARDGGDLVHALRRLTRGDLAGMFDAPSTHRLDPGAPMVVLDLSALGSDDTALAIAMTGASAWLEQSLTTPADNAGPRWVVYDEAWRLLRTPALLGRMQAQWKLSRAYGIANLLILHRLSDLDAVAATGTAGRAIAEGLLADCSTRVIYRQEADQLATTARALGLSSAEREVIAVLPRGTGLWKLPGRSHLVHHRVHVDELPLLDTDTAMTGTPTNRAAHGTSTGGPR